MFLNISKFSSISVESDLCLDSVGPLREVGVLLLLLYGLLGSLVSCESSADSAGLLCPEIQGERASLGCVMLAQLSLGVLVYDRESTGDVLAHRANASHPHSLAAARSLCYAQLGKLLLERLQLAYKLSLGLGAKFVATDFSCKAI